MNVDDKVDHIENVSATRREGKRQPFSSAARPPARPSASRRRRKDNATTTREERGGADEINRRHSFLVLRLAHSGGECGRRAKRGQRTGDEGQGASGGNCEAKC